MFTPTICHGRCFSVLNVAHYSLFVREIAFQGIVNLKTCREIEIETERLDDMLVIRKKRTKERAKKCCSRENWYVISDFVPRSVRLIRKKCTCFPIGDVRDRRRERYNRVYVLSRVRNNRVSLYSDCFHL